jgi:hypothetical protein
MKSSRHCNLGRPVSEDGGIMGVSASFFTSFLSLAPRASFQIGVLAVVLSLVVVSAVSSRSLRWPRGMKMGVWLLGLALSIPAWGLVMTYRAASSGDHGV